MRPNKINVIAGLIGLVAFVITGSYMHLSYNHLHVMADGPRLMYRSAHIYLLWASLLNIAAGTSSFSGVKTLFPRLQTVLSIMLALVPVLIFCSFFMESGASSFHRPLTRAAIYMALLGVIAQAVLGYFSCQQSSKETLK